MKLILDGLVVPKARPIVNTQTKRGVLPPRYSQWKDRAIRELARQWFGKDQIESAGVTITLMGTHNGDTDNLAGAVLDALVQAEILEDDKLKNVPFLCVKWEGATKISASIEFSDIKFKACVKTIDPIIKDLTGFPC